MHNFYQKKKKYSKVQKSIFSGIPGACLGLAGRRGPRGPESEAGTCEPVSTRAQLTAFVAVILPQTVERALIPVT